MHHLVICELHAVFDVLTEELLTACGC